MTGQDVAIATLRELDVIGGVDAPDYADVSYVLGKLNRVLDNWAAEWGPAYVSTITTYTITPSLQPHTIGPSTATWTVTQRPESIEAANLVVSGVRTPLAVHESDWWMNLSDPTQTSDEPTDVMYTPTYPNGSLYFWPVPGTACSIELMTRGLLAQMTLAGTVSLPPGYYDALVLTGAEECADHFHATVTPRLLKSAVAARGRIAAANARTPRLTSDAPGVGQGGWDYQTGSFR